MQLDSRAPWVISMGWHDLCFIHWAIEPQLLRPLIPAGLEIDTFEGTAWIGLVPFRMSAVCPRGVPRWKWLSDFPEMNVRTYVTDGRASGVWFFSLDATQPLAVWAARTFFSLPYFQASISCQWETGARDPWHYYFSHRERSDPSLDFAARYRPIERPILSRPGSLEYFLTERYWLFAQDRRGRLQRARIHHVPWPLQEAEIEIQRCTYMHPYGLGHMPPPDCVHFARDLFVYSWPLQPSP